MLFRHDNLRPSQELLYNDILNTIEKGSVGIFEAPTGLGKTDASISAALNYAMKNDKKVFYITPKNSQHRIAIDVVRGINKKHQTKIRAIDFVTKSLMCTDPFIYGLGSEFYTLCDKKVKKNMCIGFLNTVGKSVEQRRIAYSNVKKFEEEHYDLNYEDFRYECLKGNVLCPYELSLSLVKDANLVVVDVNHIFIPSIRTKLFNRMKVQPEDCIFIFDEAHNLPSRIRNISSNSISRRTINNCLDELLVIQKEYDVNTIRSFLDELSYMFYETKPDYANIHIFDDLFSRYNYDRILEDMAKYSENYMSSEEKKSAFTQLLSFFNIWFETPESKTRFFDSRGNLNIKSLDASIYSSEILNNSHSTILMSATLSPVEMYRSVLGLEKDTYYNRYLSPFPNENRLVMISSDITSKYDERVKSIPQMCDRIVEIINGVSGNQAVFFPSYNFMADVYNKIKNRTSKKIFLQNPKDDAITSQKMIDDFKKMKNSLGGVLFAVAGGSFSEGVDFPGEDLIGIIVAGLPFPEPDFEMKALIDYYEKKYGNGWDFAYVYPTISKIIQTAGRPIRTESDRAFIVLLDKRYAFSKYKNMFPNYYNFLELDIQKIKDFRNENSFL